ncbi:hypothetical protein QBC43DRAFT_121802 [Cladorrhinum sp. PSN259]|nr:hypothetical protein QBC43DRAFT_121802 [Cladorrhinum sp. PSN259]
MSKSSSLTRFTDWVEGLSRSPTEAKGSPQSKISPGFVPIAQLVQFWKSGPRLLIQSNNTTDNDPPLARNDGMLHEDIDIQKLVERGSPVLGRRSWGFTEILIAFAALTGAILMLAWDCSPHLIEGDRFQRQAAGHCLEIHPRTDFACVPILRSPETLIVATMLTTSSLTAYHYLHRDDKHMDWLIMSSVGAGVLIGGFLGMEGTAILLCVIPWCVMMAMLLSRLLTVAAVAKKWSMDCQHQNNVNDD